MLFRFRVGAIVHRRDDVLMLQNTSEERPFWVLPGGGIDRGERLRTALARELSEELGLNLAELPEARPVLLVEVLELIHRLEVYFVVPVNSYLSLKGKESFAQRAEFVPIGEANRLLPAPHLPQVSSVDELLQWGKRFYSLRQNVDPMRVIHVRTEGRTLPMPLRQYVQDFVVPAQGGIGVSAGLVVQQGAAGAAAMLPAAELQHGRPILEQLVCRKEQAEVQPDLLGIREYVAAGGVQHCCRLLFAEPGIPASQAHRVAWAGDDDGSGVRFPGWSP